MIEYDQLKNRYFIIRKKVSFLNSKIPLQKVGYKPSKNFKKMSIESQCCLWQMLLERRFD
jgi:hypothetical protein